MITLHLRNVLALTAFTVLFACVSGHHVSFEGKSLTNNFDDDNLIRTKRELESLDNPDEFQSGTAFEEQQEESGFWDRVVRVALKIFSRFIEWLNS